VAISRLQEILDAIGINHVECIVSRRSEDRIFARTPISITAQELPRRADFDELVAGADWIIGRVRSPRRNF
jgi:hypothetical protein